MYFGMSGGVRFRIKAFAKKLGADVLLPPPCRPVP
jgi:hypothetical protein